jgi:hypothetical protein
MPSVVLDNQHKYWLGSRQLLGTTTALKLAGLIDDRWYNPEALQRGSYVHQMVHYDVEGDLDETSVDPRLLGYLQASRALKQQAGAKVAIAHGRPAVERVMADPILGLGGTSDWIGEMFGDPWALIDWKTGDAYAWHAIQTAMYERLAKSSGVIPPNVKVQRYVGYLRKDGTFKVEPCNDPADLAVGLACMTVAQYQLRTAAAKRRISESDQEIFD